MKTVTLTQWNATQHMKGTDHWYVGGWTVSSASEKGSETLKDYIQYVYIHNDTLAKVKLQGQKTDLSLPGTGEYSRLTLRVQWATYTWTFKWQIFRVDVELTNESRMEVEAQRKDRRNKRKKRLKDWRRFRAAGSGKRIWGGAVSFWGTGPRGRRYGKVAGAAPGPRYVSSMLKENIATTQTSLHRLL